MIEHRGDGVTRTGHREDEEPNENRGDGATRNLAINILEQEIRIKPVILNGSGSTL